MQKVGLGNNSASNKIIQDFWIAKGLDASTLFIADGSGLSRLNYISPHNFSLLLKFMFNQKDFPVFMETLPVLGKSGTLSSLGKSLKNNDKLSAKSGSMNRVRCYAGYVKNNKNEDWAFAVMFNNFNCQQNEVLKKVEVLFDKMLKSD
jgi:D-alanyl-D-alanine carboxypeptidase/D-alanyl-D-alanine-endopeptidase (penicillin-binding protein 4)